MMLGCRFFSEGGDFAPEEVKMLQRRLMEEIKMLSVSEENIYGEQEQFQFTSFQQVSTGTLDGEKQFCLFLFEVIINYCSHVFHLYTLSPPVEGGG